MTTDDPLESVIWGRLAQWGLVAFERGERHNLADEAVEAAEGLGDPSTLAACLEYRLLTLIGPDDIDTPVGSARRVTEIGRELRDPELTLRGTECELRVEFERGDFAAADRLAHSMCELAERIGQPEYLRPGHL